MLPILVTFVVRGVTFIGLWMGPEYAAPSGAVLTILAIARGPGSGYQVCVSTLMGLNRHRGLVPITLLEATANVALSLALVGPLGISGVALGTLIPRLFVTGIFGPRFVQKTIGLAPTRYYREVWGRPALAMIPFTVATVFLERLAAPPHLAAFFAEVALVLPVAAAGAWLVALRPEEKTRIGVALRTALARTR
jgi:O-antigen/teichoic acid export membrane protein